MFEMSNLKLGRNQQEKLIMLAHRKLWESAITFENYLIWLQDYITTYEEFSIMNNDNPHTVLSSIETRMWMMFFALYFADEHTELTLDDGSKFMEV